MKKIVIIIITMIAFVYCAERTNPEPQTIIASVDGENLTLEQILASYGEKEWNAMSKDDQKEFINQWINLTALANQAKREEHIRDDKALKFAAKNAEKKIYANAIVSDALNSLAIKENELLDYYRLNIPRFSQTAREYQVQRIFFETEEDMQNVKQMLDRGQIEYTPAAQRYSKEELGATGGHMGFITKTGPDSLLWKAMNTRQRFYTVTMPYNNGWIIARYINSREGTATTSLEDVRDKLTAELREQKRADIYNRVLREARIHADISIEY